MRALVCAALSAVSLFGSDTALDRIADAADRLRYLPADQPEAARPLVRRLQGSLREWVEARLPKAFDNTLGAKLNAELRDAGLFAPKDAATEYGYVGTFEVARPVAGIQGLLVVAGAKVPCGSEDSASFYEWTADGPVRTLEARGEGEIEGVHFSSADDAGDRLAVVASRTLACATRWGRLSYQIFRLRNAAGGARPIYNGSHSIYLGAGASYSAQVSPEDVLLRFEDHSIDPAVGVRTHVLHFQVAEGTVTRIDPVAVEPRDFVEEWLRSPWLEMESRTAPAAAGEHRSLHSESIRCEFKGTIECPGRPDHWQIAADFPKPHAAEDEDPVRTLYFLVRQTEADRFEMVGVGGSPHRGCPAAAAPR